MLLRSQRIVLQEGNGPSAAQRVLGIPELVQAIFSYLYDPWQQPKFAFKSTVLVNRLWFHLSSALIWRRCSLVNLLAVRDPVRRQFYADRILTIQDTTPLALPGGPDRYPTLPRLECMDVSYEDNYEWVPRDWMLRGLIHVKLFMTAVSQDTLHRLHQGCPNLQVIHFAYVDLIESKSDDDTGSEDTSNSNHTSESEQRSEIDQTSEPEWSIDSDRASKDDKSKVVERPIVWTRTKLESLTIGWEYGTEVVEKLCSIMLSLFDVKLFDVRFNKMSRECAVAIVKSPDVFNHVEKIWICGSTTTLPVLAPNLREVYELGFKTEDEDLSGLEVVGSLEKLCYLTIHIECCSPVFGEAILPILQRLPNLRAVTVNRRVKERDYNDMVVPHWSEVQMRQYLEGFRRLSSWRMHDIPREEDDDPDIWSNFILGCWLRWCEGKSREYRWARTELDFHDSRFWGL